jgi:hypothetical protein
MGYEKVTEAQLLDLVEAARRRREELEAELRETRATSRALALELLFRFGYPLKRVETLTGHMRPTLRSWIAVAQSSGRRLNRDQLGEM